MTTTDHPGIWRSADEAIRLAELRFLPADDEPEPFFDYTFADDVDMDAVRAEVVANRAKHAAAVAARTAARWPDRAKADQETEATEAPPDPPPPVCGRPLLSRDGKRQECPEPAGHAHDPLALVRASRPR
jgi:hypothetical protein